MPGYLPECEVPVFETQEDAKAYLRDEMEFDRDNCDDAEMMTNYDDTIADLDENIGEWECLVNNTVYWVKREA